MLSVAMACLNCVLWWRVHRYYRKKKKKRSRDKEGGAESDSDDEVGAIDLDRERYKARLIVEKQEKLLFVCFHVLLNLAEDMAIEKKMVKVS